MKKTLYLFIILTLLFALAVPTIAQDDSAPTCESSYTVQAGDWLSKVAEKYLGDVTAYEAIVSATNAMAGGDSTYNLIENADVIEPGWMLCIPAGLSAGDGMMADDATTGESGDAAMVDDMETALKNATYTGIFDEPITLADGEYEGEPYVEGGAARPMAYFDRYASGDLDGDGVEDAAVLVGSMTGGSGMFTYLAVMLNQDGQWVNVATEFLGDRVSVEKFFVERMQIGLDMITQGPDDPMCCPTLEVSTRYQLIDDVLANLDGNVTADQLMNSEYQSEFTASGLAPLVDGEYSEQAAPGSATMTNVMLNTYSNNNDLNGDSKRDGAAVLVTDPGGSGTFYTLHAVVMQGTKATDVAYTNLGDRVVINSVFINANQQIIVDMLTRGDDEPMAAEPTIEMTKVYQLQGNQLVDVTPASDDDMATDTAATEEPAAEEESMADDAPMTYVYQCDAGKTFSATYNNADSDNITADVMLDGEMITLPLVPAASGAKYSDGTTTLWTKGDEGFIEVDGETTYENCLGEMATDTAATEEPAAEEESMADDTSMTLVYQCDEDKSFSATYKNADSDNITADVMLDGKMITLPLVPAASGAKYSDGTTTLWTQGNGAFIEVDDEMTYTNCVTEM